MSHTSSRRRSYGRRQKDLRERRATDLVIDQDGPRHWPRGRGWDGTPEAGPGHDPIERSHGEAA
jgi:hypothetical protein